MSDEDYNFEPSISIVDLAKRFNQNVNPEVRKALEKESEIPPEYIPQDMDDGLQQILGCGKYAKEYTEEEN